MNQNLIILLKEERKKLKEVITAIDIVIKHEDEEYYQKREKAIDIGIKLHEEFEKMIKNKSDQDILPIEHAKNTITTYTKDCQECSKEFITANKMQMFCNDKCQKKNYNKKYRQNQKNLLQNSIVPKESNTIPVSDSNNVTNIEESEPVKNENVSEAIQGNAKVVHVEPKSEKKSRINVTKKCLECNTDFKPTTNAQKFCEIGCKVRYKATHDKSDS